MTKMYNNSGYGVKITSVKVGGVELLQSHPIIGVFDTGGSCVLLPNISDR